MTTSSVAVLLVALNSQQRPCTISLCAAAVLRNAYEYLLRERYLAAPSEVGEAMSTLLILTNEVRRSP